MERIKFICATKGMMPLVELLKDILVKQFAIKTTHQSENTSYLKKELDTELLQYETCACMEFSYQSEDYSIYMIPSSSKGNGNLECILYYWNTDTFSKIEDSALYNFKVSLHKELKKKFAVVLWLEDTQNSTLAKELYREFQLVERYQKSIVETYLIHKYGVTWFTQFDFSGLLMTHKKFAIWFKNSSYDTFESVNFHLQSWNTKDFYLLLKCLQNKVSANRYTLWEIEGFHDVFKEDVVQRWKTDLLYRKEMIESNSIISKDMYHDTMLNLRNYKKDIEEAEKILKNRLGQENKEQIEHEVLGNKQEKQSPDQLPQKIRVTIGRSKEYQEFVQSLKELSKAMLLLKDIQREVKNLQYEKELFYKEDKFDCEAYDKYLKVFEKQPQYPNWIEAIHNMNTELFTLVLQQVNEASSNLASQLQNMSDMFWVSSLDVEKEGQVVRFVNENGELFEVKLVLDKENSMIPTFVFLKNKELISQCTFDQEQKQETEQEAMRLFNEEFCKGVRNVSRYILTIENTISELSVQ